MTGTIIIAEVGVNHNGEIDLAKKLIDIAAKAGADMVKFQTYKTENLVTLLAPKAEYQLLNDKNPDSQFTMLKKLELSRADHVILLDHCKKRNIRFLSTAFDLDSLDFLISLNMGVFKVPSGEITNLPLLKKIGSQNQQVILSTGMADMQEIQDAVDALVNSGTEKHKITILHCTTEYPTPMANVNLRAMLSIKETFGVDAGLSDHTQGIEIPIAAVTLGAKIIEKHFTLDKTMKGPDHKASLDPDELKAMIQAIRNIEKALGDGFKRPSDSELKNKAVARKSIHFSQDLLKGKIIQDIDLVMKRPGNGISPMLMEKVIGKKLKINVSADTLVKWEDVE